jgi:hypothetical protein
MAEFTQAGQQKLLYERRLNKIEFSVPRTDLGSL